MAVSLDATPGSSTANSYITLADAEAYLADERLEAAPAAWTEASDDTKSKALISATRVINALPFPGRSYWCGKLVDGRRRQALFFPRTTDGIQGALQIPPAVRQATVELALYLIDQPAEDVQRRNLQHQGVTSVTLGKLHEQYRTGPRHLIDLCPAAKELLGQVGLGAPLPLG